jgi:hypothetical protein
MKNKNIAIVGRGKRFKTTLAETILGQEMNTEIYNRFSKIKAVMWSKDIKNDFLLLIDDPTKFVQVLGIESYSLNYIIYYADFIAETLSDKELLEKINLYMKEHYNITITYCIMSNGEYRECYLF